MTKKVSKALLDAMKQEAASCGLFVEVVSGGKHNQMIISNGRGGTKKIPFAGTPRTTDNQTRWVRQDIRRAARELR